MKAKLFRNLIIDTVRQGKEVAPRCPHAQVCGGCAFQERAYVDQVAAKEALLQQLWAGYEPTSFLPCDPKELTVTPSPNPFGYRTRMDYVTTKGRFGLRMRGRFNYIVELETCHLIPPAAFHAVRQVWLQAQTLNIPDYHVRTHEGFLRYLVVRRSPQEISPGISPILIAAITASRDYQPEMEHLAAVALEQPGVVGFHWLLNETLTDVSFGESIRQWGTTTLPMLAGMGKYGAAPLLNISANTFFQNNVYLLLPLFDAVVDAVLHKYSEQREAHIEQWYERIYFGAPPQSRMVHPIRRVVDLYSGVGAIAIYLAQAVHNMRNVSDTDGSLVWKGTHGLGISHDALAIVAVESNGESAALARYNIALNQARNVTVAASDVVTFLQRQAYGSVDVVIADPPRTGMGERVCLSLLRLLPRRIIYVSCNPLTQMEDIRILSARYRLTALHGYDMFPHTPHLEMLAILDARE